MFPVIAEDAGLKAGADEHVVAAGHNEVDAAPVILQRRVNVIEAGGHSSVPVGEFAWIARAIFTLAIRITALGWFFAHAMYCIRLLSCLLKDFHFSSSPCLLRI